MRKYRSIVLVTILFAIIVIMMILAITILKKNNIIFFRGKVINTFEETVYSDGTFLIETDIETDHDLYMDSFQTLDSINKKYKTNIHVGDVVYVLAKRNTTIEIAPGPIEIYMIFKLF